MKNSMQLKAMVRNLSNQKNVKHEIILRNYMLERLLERISLSQYRNNFILKGGMLIASMLGIDIRSTMDMDTTVKGQEFSETKIEAMLKEIISIDANDNVTMRLLGIENIRDEAEYPGLRVSIETILDRTRQILKVDITTGDVITPKEINYEFPLMFEEKTLPIKAYNIETVIAEKFETIISRGITNTRMRDFYDIYILSYDKTPNFSKDNLVKAIEKTSQKRDSFEILLHESSNVIEVIYEDKDMKTLWDSYRKKYIYAEHITWENIHDALKCLWKECNILK